MKTSGSYLSLVQGVSEQVPQRRAPGQCTESVNILPDPVEGLSRRHGSLMMVEKNLALPTSNIAAMTADTDNWRSFEHTFGGKDYVILIRRSSQSFGSTLPMLIAYNRTDSVFLNYQRNLIDPLLNDLENGGCSAVTSVGRYIFMAGHTIVPAATSVNRWSDATNQSRTAVWVRGGAYSRTFSATLTKLDGATVTVGATTPSSSYQGVLDTSGVPVFAADPAGGTQADTEAAYVTQVGSFGEATLSWAAWNPTGMTVKDGTTTLTNVSPADPANATQYRWDAGSSFVRLHSSMVGQLDVTMTYTHTKTITNPNYAKQVADITNEYNTAVTQWIGTAAEATQPTNIAEQLKTAAVAAGLTATRYGSHVVFDGIKGVSVSDGGDGSLIRGVANEISSITEVTDYHYVGKVVKVRASGSDDAFYLKATAKDLTVTSGVTEVIWVEGAGVEHTIDSALIYATISGNNIYVASSATLLNAILPGTHPGYIVSKAGDTDTSPLPHFIGKTINYLGTFQDRLLVCAGAVVHVSRIGDYLDFFRSSVLTARADDAFSVMAKNSDDDTIRYSTEYDRDLVLFGDKRQYALSGRSALTPTSAHMPIISHHPNAADVPPLASGSGIFYSKVETVSSSVHEIRPGVNPEQPDSSNASSQLNRYITGRTIELADHAKPSVVFVRSTGKRNSLFTFHYLDAEGGQRQQAAWGRWDFDPALGPIIGMCRTAAGLLVFFLRVAQGSVWVVADLCKLTAGLSQYPYLDSLRTWPTVALALGTVRQGDGDPWRIAFDDSTEFRLRGDDLSNATEFFLLHPDVPNTAAWVGSDQPTNFTPTNPFMRDRSGAAITTGLLTVARLVVSFKNSSGFTADVTTAAGTVSRTFNGRVIGDPNNLVGIIPITTGQSNIMVGSESRKYTASIKANSWYPLTIDSLEWVGQFFNRTQRVS